MLESRDMRVCASCGVIAPDGSLRCGACGAAPLASRLVPDRADRSFWVRMRAELTCRSCGQKSPLSSLDLDGTVTCVRCGFVQALDVTVWSDVLALAHGVGDLAWPKPDGRFPVPDVPSRTAAAFASIGVSDFAHRFEETGLVTQAGVMRSRSISAEIAPGQPLCDACRTPLDARVEADRTIATCATCRVVRTYAMPARSPEVYALPYGLVAGEHCLDGAAPRTDVGAGGVLALRCPTCNAAIEATPSQSLVSCAFCRTLCRIPSKTLSALFASDSRGAPIWLLYSGMSDLRGRLVARARVAAEQEAVAARERRRQEESQLGLDAPRVVEDGPADRAIRLLAVLATVAAVGAIGFGREIVALFR